MDSLLFPLNGIKMESSGSRREEILGYDGRYTPGASPHGYVQKNVGCWM